ncbi:MAG: cytidine deaminase [Clostridiales bacterium]|nr:cytidine deaminase [Clostridiales bacterium]
MDIWEELYLKAKAQYRPGDLSPFFYAHHVACALEAENGKIYTGFCIEGASGVLNLCAERVAAVNMIVDSDCTAVRRLVVLRDVPPYESGNFLPCGACREFFMQLDIKNKDMEILTDYHSRATVKLSALIERWWGEERYIKEGKL